jgi:hypothetical protein
MKDSNSSGPRIWVEGATVNALGNVNKAGQQQNQQPREAGEEEQQQVQQQQGSTMSTSRSSTAVEANSSERQSSAVPTSSAESTPPAATAVAAAGDGVGASGRWLGQRGSNSGLKLNSSSSFGAGHWASRGALGGTIGPGLGPSDAQLTPVTSGSAKGEASKRGWWFFGKRSSVSEDCSNGVEYQRTLQQEQEKKKAFQEQQQRKRQVQQHLQLQQQQLMWKLDTQEQMVGSRVIWMGEFVHLVRPLVYVLLLKR